MTEELYQTIHVQGLGELVNSFWGGWELVRIIPEEAGFLVTFKPGQEKTMTEKRCKDCQYWENPVCAKLRVRRDGTLVDRALQAKVPQLRTDSHFGCVYYTETDMSVHLRTVHEIRESLRERSKSWNPNIRDETP